MDLYALLGVSRGASAGDIERAYRRLARRYHPGVNPGDARAAQLYRQIQEAYGILGDRKRRQEYDRGGARPPDTLQAAVTFEGFDFGSRTEGPLAGTFSELFSDVFQAAAREATGPSRGASLEITLPLSFEDAVRGGRFPVSVVRQVPCPACAGQGCVPRPPQPCAACSGAGSQRWVRGHLVFTKPCDACGGSGRITSQPCPACSGVGVHPRSEVVTVAVPPGVESGARMAVPGRGHAGARGAAPGDLYVTVEVAPHPFFRREGRDVHVTLPVAVHEAVLGARVDVPTLDEPVRLRIPPGTPSGRRLRLRGRGVPSPFGGDAEAGDLIVEVLIVLPAVRDERSRELLREFGRLNDVDVRRHLFERRAGTAPQA
jgi:molecular chaperone DnaJ